MNVVTFLHSLEGTNVTITTLSSREFNQSASEAKKAANHGPVFITDRGRPAHVLMSMALYQSLTGSRQKIADLLAMPGSDASNVSDASNAFDLEIPRSRDLAQPADLS
jgi:prevent-host-death family protein